MCLFNAAIGVGRQMLADFENDLRLMLIPNVAGNFGNGECPPLFRAKKIQNSQFGFDNS